MDWNVWGPPLAVLGGGLIVGGIWAVISVSGEKTSDPKPELEARKRQLMEALRELDADKAKMDPAEYALQRNALVEKAATTLAQLEGPEDAPILNDPSQRKTKGGLWFSLALMSVFLIALAVVLQKYTGARGENDSLTGGIASSKAEAERKERLKKANEVLSPIFDRLRKAQTDVESKDITQQEYYAIQKTVLTDLKAHQGPLNVVVYDSILTQNYQTALNLNSYAMKNDQDDLDSKMHYAILLQRYGKYQKASEQERYFRGAIETINDVVEKGGTAQSRLWRADLLLNINDDKVGAKKDLDAAEPELKLQAELFHAKTLRAIIEAPPPILTGSISLPKGYDAPSGGTLFIIVRRSEAPGGPPLAVVKKRVTRFPYAFGVGKGDLMMGGEWPEEVWITARLDMDGRPLPASDLDWQGSTLGPFSGETSEIQIPLSPGKGAKKSLPKFNVAVFLSDFVKAHPTEVAKARDLIPSLNEQLKDDPKDLSVLYQLSKMAIVTGDYKNAMALIDQAKGVDEKDPGLLANLAVMRGMIGRYDAALSQLDAALASKPNMQDFKIWKSMLLLGQSKIDQSKALLNSLPPNDSDPMMNALLPFLTSKIEAQRMAKIDVQTVNAAQASSASVDKGDDVKLTGRITLGGNNPPNGVVFIIARPTNQATGRPVATKKIPVKSFPMDFTMTDSNLMASPAWPKEFWIQARLDTDGNAWTKAPEDWASDLVGPYSVGSDAVVTLKPE